MTERPMQAAHLTCITLIRGAEVVIWNSGLLRAVALLVVIQRGLPPEELRSLACCRVFVKSLRNLRSCAIDLSDSYWGSSHGNRDWSSLK